MLQGVVRGKPKPPRIELHGPPGVGKSTFGADAEKPVFVTTEDGVDNLPVDQFPRADTWQTVLDNVNAVATGDHEYETIVLDTLNGAVELAAEHVCQTLYGGQWTAKKGDGGFLAWGQGWKATSEEVKPLLAALDQCRARGMTVIMLSHVGLQSVKHPTAGDYNKFAPDIDKTVWARFSKWADIVLRADYEYSVVNSGQGKGRAIGTSTRHIIAAGSAAEDAKCRVGYELPDKFSLSYAEFTAHLGKGTPTLDEVRTLWGLMSKDEETKALQWLGITSLAELDKANLTHLRNLLNRLRQKSADQAENETAQEKGEAA